MAKAYLVNSSGARQGEAVVELIQVLDGEDGEHVTLHFGPTDHPLGNCLELVIENEEALGLADEIYRALSVSEEDNPDDVVTPTDSDEDIPFRYEGPDEDGEEVLDAIPQETGGAGTSDPEGPTEPPVAQ